ncbi:hypothetical protein, partial [Salmonella enterica]|uniref:hypothetical protein n=1 Tax=Salmonella enterica TaxID=28901 RepID=UPI0022B676B7
LSESGPVISWEIEKTSVNRPMASAMSATGVLNLAARAGNEGSRMFSGKKLINEMFIISMKRDANSRLE